MKKLTNYELLDYNHDDDTWQTKRIRLIVRSMPDGAMKRVVYSKYWEGLTFRDINKKYKQYRGWAWYYWHKAQAYIRDKLED